MEAKKNRRLCQFNATLRGVSPPIWRRIQIWENYTLAQLHRVLQVAMGWENYHLYEFRIARRLYREPYPENERKILDAERTRILAASPGMGAEFEYVYDCGDGWHHELLLEAILLPTPNTTYPQCIGGERSCPPEDVGGPGGYANYLQAMSDPGHARHEEMTTWRGWFDPEAFSVEKSTSNSRGSFVPFASELFRRRMPQNPARPPRARN